LANVYIWKFKQGNYFEGIDFLDKINIEGLLLESFPIFNFITEEISGIAHYKTGDFDLRIIDGKETSNNEIVSIFFRGGTRKFKYVVGIQFVKAILGFTTNEFIKFNYLIRVLEISCTTPETEAKQSINKGFVGLLDTNRTFDDFLVNILRPQNITRLNVTKAFNSYGTLIGNPNVILNAQLQEAWICWQNQCGFIY
jgi:hypothetical protein